MASEVLMEAETVSVRLEQDIKACVKRVLIRERQWLPDLGMTDDEYAT